MLDIQVDQRDTQDLRIRDADRVEGDVDAPRVVDHELEMPFHGLFVESIDLRRLGGSAAGNDFLGDTFDRCQVAPGEEEIGPLSRKGPCDSAADPASGSVDHRNLVLQHHLWFLSVPGGHTWPPQCKWSRRRSRHHDAEEVGAHLPPSSPDGRCRYCWWDDESQRRDARVER